MERESSVVGARGHVYTPAQVEAYLSQHVAEFFRRGSYGALQLRFVVRTFELPTKAELEAQGDAPGKSQGDDDNDNEQAKAATAGRRQLEQLEAGPGTAAVCSTEGVPTVVIEDHVTSLKEAQGLRDDFTMLLLPCWGTSTGVVIGEFSTVQSTDLAGIAMLAEHELGHNLGLDHAAEFNDVRHDTYPHAGEARDYGDRHDRMGHEPGDVPDSSEAPRGGLYNAAYARRLHWIPDRYWRTVRADEQSAVVRIFAFDQGRLPTSTGAVVGAHVEMGSGLSAVLSYRRHAEGAPSVASSSRVEPRVEAHLFPIEGPALIYGDNATNVRNPTEYTQSFVVDWQHDAAGKAICDARAAASTSFNACQLGLGQADGAQALPPGRAAQATVEVVGGGMAGAEAYLDVRVVRRAAGPDTDGSAPKPTATTTTTTTTSPRPNTPTTTPAPPEPEKESDSPTTDGGEAGEPPAGGEEDGMPAPDGGGKEVEKPEGEDDGVPSPDGGKAGEPPVGGEQDGMPAPDGGKADGVSGMPHLRGQQGRRGEDGAPSLLQPDTWPVWALYVAVGGGLGVGLLLVAGVVACYCRRRRRRAAPELPVELPTTAARQGRRPSLKETPQTTLMEGAPIKAGAYA